MVAMHGESGGVLRGNHSAMEVLVRRPIAMGNRTETERRLFPGKNIPLINIRLG